jgi:hypothetical protein
MHEYLPTAYQPTTAAPELRIDADLQLDAGQWIRLLAKYMTHVAASEGEWFATNFELMAPCGMGKDAFTPQDLAMLSAVAKAKGLGLEL